MQIDIDADAGAVAGVGLLSHGRASTECDEVQPRGPRRACHGQETPGHPPRTPPTSHPYMGRCCAVCQQGPRGTERADRRRVLHAWRQVLLDNKWEKEGAAIQKKITGAPKPEILDSNEVLSRF